MVFNKFPNRGGVTINSLDDKQRQLLFNLILFESPFPISAAAEIFGAQEGDILSLYDRTMLTRIESDDVYGQINIPEYWLYKLHPAIRNYLESKKPRNVEQESGEAFSRYYWNFLSETYKEWGKENHLPSIARFNIIAESEYSDFDKAIELSKNNRQVASGISSLLGLIFSNLGISSKGLGYHRRSLGIDEEINDKVGMGADYTNIGILLGQMGKPQEALESYNKALKIHEELNDRVGMAKDYTNIGNVLPNMGKHQEALDSYNKALKIDEELNDKVGMANDYWGIGNVLDNLDNHQEALDSYNKSLWIHEELNDKVGMAKDYYNISFVLSKTSKDEALKSLDKVLVILQEFERTNGYHHLLMDDVNKMISYLEG